MSTKLPQPPAEKEHSKDDGILDSFGKAIVDPVKTGAEEEEPKEDGSILVPPGG